MFEFNKINEDLNFNDIKIDDESNVIYRGAFENIFLKIISSQDLTDNELKLFLYNCENDYIYKYKVNDKLELEKILGNRTLPTKEIQLKDSNDVWYIFDLNWLDVSGITNMSNLFRVWHGGLFDVSKWDVSNVTNMAGLFFGINDFNCDIGNWDVSNVTNMMEMFKGCSKFNQDISNWDVSSVTNMQSMFSGCVDFNQDISNWDVRGVVNMMEMFKMCYSFSYDLSKWDVQSLQKCDYIFSNCVKIIDKKPNWYYDIWKQNQIS